MGAPSEARRRAGVQGQEKRRRAGRISIADVRRLRWLGLISDPLKPLALEAERELGALLTDKGDGVTAAERVVLEDVARLGLLLRAEFGRFLATQSPDAARAVNAIAGQRRASLQAVGLERRARDVTVLDVVAELEAEKSGRAVSKARDTAEP